MAGRRIKLVSLFSGLLVLGYSTTARSDPPVSPHWDQTKAGIYLDKRGESWFKFGAAYRGQGAAQTTCISCHSLLSYALARPVLRRLSNEDLPTEFETKILEQTKRRVANWHRLDGAAYQLFYDFDDDKKKQSRGTESVLNALVLALDDRGHDRRQPSEDTRKALEILWATQIKDGEHAGSWEWLNFGLEPWESKGGRYLGATLAALAASAAEEPAHANNDVELAQRIAALRGYLRKNFRSENLHNRIWMLWAASSMDGLLSSQEKDELFEQILAKQQQNGGWSLASLGGFTYKNAPAELAAPDGYATGLVLHVLQTAGLSKEHPGVSKGLSWLQTNQDATGGWRALSMNKKRAPESKEPAKANLGQFMWDAATAYAILALGH